MKAQISVLLALVLVVTLIVPSVPCGPQLAAAQSNPTWVQDEEIKLIGTYKSEICPTGPGCCFTTVEVQEVLLGPSVDGNIYITTPATFGCPCLGTAEPGLSPGDTVEVYGLLGDTWPPTMSICPAANYYIKRPALPDFAISKISWSPQEPEVLEKVTIDVHVSNVGEDYVPNLGTVEVELKLRDKSDEWTWIFTGTLDAILANDEEQFVIDPFLFYNGEIDEIEACLTVDDPESDAANNCKTETITVDAPVKPWRACVGMLIGVVESIIESIPVGKVYEGTKQISRIYSTHVPNVIVACQEFDFTCAKASMFFLGDSAITLGRLLAESTVFIWLSIGRAAVQQFWDSVECGEYLATVYRAWTEAGKHKNIDANVVAAHSPILIRAVNDLGQRAGFLDNGAIVTEIPGAEVMTQGGRKAVLYPGTDTVLIELKGTATGTFDLFVSLSQAGPDVHTVNYRNVPVTSQTTGAIDVVGGTYTLAMDDDGDGTTDRTVQPTEEIHTHIYRTYVPAVMRSH